MGMVVQTFIIIDIGLYKRVYNNFRYDQIIKIPLHHEHIVLYYGGFAFVSPTYYFVLQTKTPNLLLEKEKKEKDKCIHGSVVCLYP